MLHSILHYIYGGVGSWPLCGHFPGTLEAVRWDRWVELLVAHGWHEMRPMICYLLPHHCHVEPALPFVATDILPLYLYAV